MTVRQLESVVIDGHAYVRTVDVVLLLTDRVEELAAEPAPACGYAAAELSVVADYLTVAALAARCVPEHEPRGCHRINP